MNKINLTTLTLTGTNNFSSRLDLTIQNTNVNSGTTNFFAMNTVELETESHLNEGSETHLFLAPTFENCDELGTGTGDLDFRLQNNPSQTGQTSLELQFRKNSYISIYPNPNAGYFNLEYKGYSAGTKDISVHDVFGKLVLKTTIAENLSVINMSDYPKGIYFLQLNDQIQIFNQKIVIQ